MMDSLKTMPGVEAVAVATGAPTTGAYMNASISIAARTEPDNAEAQRAFVSVVSPDYFRAIGNPLKQGRLFTEA
jgi:hypothetical protein